MCASEIASIISSSPIAGWDVHAMVRRFKSFSLLKSLKVIPVPHKHSIQATYFWHCCSSNGGEKTGLGCQNMNTWLPNKMFQWRNWKLTFFFGCIVLMGAPMRTWGVSQWNPALSDLPLNQWGWCLWCWSDCGKLYMPFWNMCPISMINRVVLPYLVALCSVFPCEVILQKYGICKKKPNNIENSNSIENSKIENIKNREYKKNEMKGLCMPSHNIVFWENKRCKLNKFTEKINIWHIYLESTNSIWKGFYNYQKL